MSASIRSLSALILNGSDLRSTKPSVFQSLGHPGIMSTHIQDSHAFHGISIHASITVAPENVDVFLAALKPCLDADTADPECNSVYLFQDPHDLGHFQFVENWSKDKQWFRNVKSPPRKA